MQPNLAQDEKFAYGRSKDILAHYLNLSAQASATFPRGLDDVTVLVWPESAFPFIYERESWAAEAIAAALPANVTLVTGAVRYDTPPKGQVSPFFNAIRVIDHQGRVLNSTDKVHLVPFGEYLPFQAVLEELGLEQLTRVRGGFSSGAALSPLSVPGLPLASPLVCYEIIFPGKVIPQGQRPGLLLNVTNDAWFGNTPGPYQHFAQARLRAVEEGLPLVRAANTGISAIVDPLGRIVAGSALGEEALVDGWLPEPLETVPGAATAGRLTAICLILSGFVLALIPRRLRFARKS
jgi:apolipoprotein N-acyltransferase